MTLGVRWGVVAQTHSLRETERGSQMGDDSQAATADRDSSMERYDLERCDLERCDFKKASSANLFPNQKKSAVRVCLVAPLTIRSIGVETETAEGGLPENHERSGRPHCIVMVAGNVGWPC